jgi:hypothetical protein
MSAPLPYREIQITDAMVVAGARVLSEMSFDLADGFVSPSEVAEAVFLAMREAQESAGEDQ